MKLVGKVPVEALDEERLTNIERRLVVQVSEMRQPPMRAPRRLLAFAGVAMAVAIAVFVGYRLGGDGTPVVGPEEPERYAVTAGALDLGDAQITGADFTVERTPTRVDVRMSKAGLVDLHVDHDPSRLFVVHAGDVEIEDIGTRFSVDWDGDKHVEVRVTEGEVRVRSGGKTFDIVAGNAWTVEIGPITLVELDGRLAAAAAVASVDEPASHEDSGKPDTLATARGSGNHPSGTPRQPKPATSNARKALEALDIIEPPVDAGTSDPRQAIVEYSKRASGMGSGQDTTKMLYSMAVIQHRSKNDAAALRTLQGVTVREGAAGYQAGMWLEVRIRCLQAFDDACRRAAERYRNKFPSGRATGVVDAVLGEISRLQ